MIDRIRTTAELQEELRFYDYERQGTGYDPGASGYERQGREMSILDNEGHDPQGFGNISELQDVEPKKPANTFDLLAKIVAETRCKPNWHFRLVDEDGALRLVINVRGRDNFDHSKPFTVDHYHPVPTVTFNEKSWRRWIFDQCMRTEAHEVGENLRFGEGDNECRPFLPTHGPGEDPYAIREYRHEDDAFTTQDGSMRVGPGPSGVRK